MIAKDGRIADVLRFLPRREVLLLIAMLGFMTFLILGGRISLLLTIFIDFAIFAIVTLSLNLEVGFAGVSQFGRVMAVISGGFAVGAIPGRLLALYLGLPAGARYGADDVNYKVVPQLSEFLAGNIPLSIGFFVFSLLLAAVAGAGIGWLTSRPAIRLKEAYLGISLLAFGDFLMWVGHNWEPLVGGTTSVFIPDPFRIVYGYRFQAVVMTVLLLALLLYFFVEVLTRSPFGRTMKMLRDSDVAAGVCGKDIVRVRTQALMLGSAIAAIAGGLYVIYTGTCTAIGFTRLTWTFWPWAYMMLGGIGSSAGVMLGVMLLTIMRSMITLYRFRWFGFLAVYGIDPIWLEYTLIGLVIIVVVLFMPHGLAPARVEPIFPASRVKKLLSGDQRA